MADEKSFILPFTRSQIENLIEFFEINFIDSIRSDTDIDNMDYLTDMCEIYSKLKKTLAEMGDDE